MLDMVYKGNNAPNCTKLASIDNLFDEMEDSSIKYICELSVVEVRYLM